jgi:hypothetical protein
MNEKNVVKRSVFLFLIGIILFSIIGVLLKDISYLFGFILGYLLNLVIFYLIIKMSEGILTFSMSTTIVIIMFIVKMLIYALGFIIAVKSKWFHLLGVFMGYMMTKLSIYVEGYINRGGEINE